MLKGYFTIDEAIKYTGTSRTTINRWFDNGLPKIKANKILIAKNDIDEYLTKRKIKQLV